MQSSFSACVPLSSRPPSPRGRGQEETAAISPNDIQHFLVVYEVTRGPATVEEFGSDYEAALAAYTEREHEYRERDDVDIVLLGADSLETIRQTHSS